MTSSVGGYRGLLCDLDGVVYRGQQPCRGAVDGLRAARRAGVRVLFVTNNAGHTPEGIAAHLVELGVQAAAAEVLTSSQVAAAYLAGRAADHGRPPGAAALAIGGPGVRLALERAGLPAVDAETLQDGDSVPVWAVVQGYGPDVCVRDLTEAAYAVNEGAHWVATNADATLPTARGLAPGNGSLLAAVSHATARRPDVVAGKPHVLTYQRALRLLDLPARQVLAVGDRLDTDIAGAKAAGLGTALVLTGVHGRADVEAAGQPERPDTVEDTLLGLAPNWG